MRLGGRSLGERRSRGRNSCVLKPSKMYCVEEFKFLDTNIDYTIHIKIVESGQEEEGQEEGVHGSGGGVEY